MADQMSVERY